MELFSRNSKFQASDIIGGNIIHACKYLTYNNRLILQEPLRIQYRNKEAARRVQCRDIVLGKY
jgi:hypothetical protein